MGAFYARVCTVAVAAGILTAAAATRVERLPAREDIAPMVNRIAKADRLRPATAGTIRIRTISIPAAADRQQAAVSRQLTACDPLVSPLASIGRCNGDHSATLGPDGSNALKLR